MRKAVGDAGEELSFAYETARLHSEGYPELAGKARWVGRESPAYGFDILSFAGRTFHGSPERPLAIEVKAQSLVARPSFSLYISKHEWNTANLLGEGRIPLELSSKFDVEIGGPTTSADSATRVLCTLQSSDELFA